MIVTTQSPASLICAAPEWQAVDAFLVWLADHAREGLERVRDGERWTSCDPCAPDGCRCLLGHAGDYQYRADAYSRVRGDERLGNRPHGNNPAFAFDALVGRFGLAPVVALVQSRAGELLEGRSG